MNSRLSLLKVLAIRVEEAGGKTQPYFLVKKRVSTAPLLPAIRKVNDYCSNSEAFKKKKWTSMPRWPSTSLLIRKKWGKGFPSLRLGGNIQNRLRKSDLLGF